MGCSQRATGALHHPRQFYIALWYRPAAFENRLQNALLTIKMSSCKLPSLGAQFWRRKSTMSPKTPTPIRPKPPDVDVEEQIRQRAYQLYEQRGCQNGNDMEDWLTAEEEVLGCKQAKAATA
jgi:hypothetical protein